MKYAVLAYENTVDINSKRDEAIRKSIRELFAGMCEDEPTVIGLYDTKEQAAAVASENNYELKLYADQITLTTYWVIDAYLQDDTDFDDTVPYTFNGIQFSVGDELDGYSTINEDELYQRFSDMVYRYWGVDYKRS